ncbi:MAG: hypothetical protein LBR42_03725, partial [Candidatus Methanoplasma sp.]|nr:hypothetical protein [Candidatus Methanoplasma sp.]
TAAAVILAILLVNTEDVFALDASETVWTVVFTTVSMGTTTGYTLADESFWPLAAYTVMWILMIFGSMSGSTSGGIKVYRLLILKSYITNGVYKMFHPRSVRDVRMDGHSVADDTVVSAMVVIMMFITTLAVSTVVLLVLEPGIDVMESIGLAVSAISTSGAITGDITFEELGDVSKLFLSFLMWVGRMEVVMALLIFTRTFWKDLASDLKSSREITGGKKY